MQCINHWLLYFAQTPVCQIYSWHSCYHMVSCILQCQLCTVSFWLSLSNSSHVDVCDGTDLKESSTDINLHCSGLVFRKYIHSLNLLWNQGLNIKVSSSSGRMKKAGNMLIMKLVCEQQNNFRFSSTIFIDVFKQSQQKKLSFILKVILNSNKNHFYPIVKARNKVCILLKCIYKIWKL